MSSSAGLYLAQLVDISTEAKAELWRHAGRNRAELGGGGGGILSRSLLARLSGVGASLPLAALRALGSSH